MLTSGLQVLACASLRSAHREPATGREGLGEEHRTLGQLWSLLPLSLGQWGILQVRCPSSQGGLLISRMTPEALSSSPLMSSNPGFCATSFSQPLSHADLAAFWAAKSTLGRAPESCRSRVLAPSHTSRRMKSQGGGYYLPQPLSYLLVEASSVLLDLWRHCSEPLPAWLLCFHITLPPCVCLCVHCLPLIRSPGALDPVPPE